MDSDVDMDSAPESTDHGGDRDWAVGASDEDADDEATLEEDEVIVAAMLPLTIAVIVPDLSCWLRRSAAPRSNPSYCIESKSLEIYFFLPISMR